MVRRYRVKVNGKEYMVEVEELSSSSFEGVQESVAVKAATALPTSSEVKAPRVESKQKVGDTQQTQQKEGSGAKEVKAPMAGVVVDVLVSEGQEVKVGDALLVFEAMKMENELRSEFSGVVSKVFVKPGDSIETGQTILVIE